MNDPNGLVYFRGVYHLFFQCNPRGISHGNLSWGHATSEDLVSWRERPLAILAEGDEQIYSGSVVVDHRNTSGFGVDGEPPLVAVYTSAYSSGRQAQSLAYSTDEGETWTKFDRNPVLDRASTAFRDPKVDWFATGDGTGHWLMTVVEATARQVLFFASDDLRRWRHLSVFGPLGGSEGVWECPDLFPLRTESGGVVWVLLISVDPGRVAGTGGTYTQYFVGDFDGTTFTATEPEPRRLDHGRDLYATVGFGNLPNDRRVVLGWMSNWDYAAVVPTSPWRGALSLPRELALAMVDGIRSVAQRPVPEFSVLAQTGQRMPIRPFLLEGRRALQGGDSYRLEISFEPLDASEVGLDFFVGGDELTRLRYDRATELLSLDRTRSGNTAFSDSFPSVEAVAVGLVDGRLALDVFVDRGSVEIFAASGTVTLTELVFPAQSSTGLTVFSAGGATRVLDAVVTRVTWYT
jgi:fructan beta-fructosidase